MLSLLLLTINGLLPLSGATPDSSRIPRTDVVQIQPGTTGLRLFYGRTLSTDKRLSLRLGGQYVAYRQPIRVPVDKNASLLLQPDFMIGMVQAGLIWRPFRHNSFFLTAGPAYTWHPDLNVILTADNTLNLDGLTLTPDDVGTVSLNLRWRSLLGYIGMGVGRQLPRRRVGVGAELGVYYLGKPRVRLDYTGFLETTTLDEQIPKVERNLTGYRYLPSLNLSITYRLIRP